MHKSTGNVIYSEPYIEKYGADALRYWASSSVLGEDNSFQEKDVVSGARLVNKLWNLARFVEMKCADCKEEKSTNPIDNYMIQRLNETIAKATDNFEKYDYFNARNVTEAVFWEFANDYLEFAKKRIYDNDNAAKYMTYNSLLILLKIFSPFLPFVTEEIYQSLYRKAVGEKSIHVSAWPKAGEMQSEEALAKSGAEISKVILFIRQWKHNSKLALNAPVKELIIEGIENGDADISGSAEHIESDSRKGRD